MLAVEQERKTYVVPEDVLTIEDEALLMGVRDSIRDNYFLVGRIANKYIEMTSRGGLPVTFRDIYHQVGRIVGKADRTIRYYAEVENFYTREDQLEYDILPFNFFDYARAYANWREILDYAMEYPSYSLGAIKRKFGIDGIENGTENEQEIHKGSRQLAIYSLANLISEFCDHLMDLAEESEDAFVVEDIDKINQSLRGLLAKLVDNFSERG